MSVSQTKEMGSLLDLALPHRAPLLAGQRAGLHRLLNMRNWIGSPPSPHTSRIQANICCATMAGSVTSSGGNARRQKSKPSTQRPPAQSRCPLRRDCRSSSSAGPS